MERNANFKHHQLNLEIESQSEKEGSLEIGGLVKRNIALLGNDFGDPPEQSTLWTSIIWSKFKRGIDG